jgi:alcohol dehydrogenase
MGILRSNSKKTEQPLLRKIEGKAIIFKGYGLPFEMWSRQVPELQKGEILVRTLYTTICGSDVHTYCGRRNEPSPVVLGHEIVGEIIEINSGHPGIDQRGNRIAPGDRVIWSIFAVPKKSIAPRPDIPQKSDNLFKYGHVQAHDQDVFNGGLAEYCILKDNTAIIKIAADMPLKVAATITCAHSTVMGAVRIAEAIRGKKVLIFGAGLLGITCMAMCRESGASWIGVVDREEDRLKWGKSFGADQSFVISDQNYKGKNAWPAVDIVFDMTGNPDIMKLGIESLSVGGVAVWIGAVYKEEPVKVDGQFIVRNLIQIRGLHNYNYADFLNATRFMEVHWRKYPYEQLIEGEFHLNAIDAAFEFADNAKPVRVGIIMGLSLQNEI